MIFKLEQIRLTMPLQIRLATGGGGITRRTDLITMRFFKMRARPRMMHIQTAFPVFEYKTIGDPA